MTRLIIVGRSMAAACLIGALVMYKNGGISATVVGEELQLAYNRIQLSPVLRGEKPLVQTLSRPAQWYLDHGVTVLSNEAVLAVDATSRSLTTTKQLLFWGEPIFAIGLYPFTPPIPGVQQPHVHTFRTMQDVEAVLQRLGPKMVLGGGVLGVEAAAALRPHGDDVTLVHRAGRLTEQQLDQQANDLLQAQLTGRGIRCELSSGLVSIEVDYITLLGGQRIAASDVVIATRVKPNITPIQACDVVCRQGTVVDEQLRTSMPGISAVEGCCEINGQTWGLITPCLKQAEVLAARLAGFVGAGFGWQTNETRFRVTGIGLFSTGVTDTTATGATLSAYDPFGERYRRLLTHDRRLRSVLLMSDCHGTASLTDSLAQGATAHPDWLFDRFDTQPLVAGQITTTKPALAVVGHGMVGHHFLGQCVDRNLHLHYHIVVFGEEHYVAYDRMHLSEYFIGRSA